MTDRTYHLDSITHPPHTVKAGDVFRIFDGPFSDAVVLGLSEDNWVKLARPYAYATCVGTTGPTVLLGAETMHYDFNELLKHCKRVGLERINR